MPGTKLIKAIHVLELALHPNTSDAEFIAAINGVRRIAGGATFSSMCEDYYSEPLDDRLAAHSMEISRLKVELRRTQKVLMEHGLSLVDTTKVPRRNTRPAPKSEPSFVLTEEEWASIESIVPPNHRTEKGRTRISAIIGVLRTQCGWRKLDQHCGNKWTTYYNQYNSWQYEGWWIAALQLLNDQAGMS